jgi:2-iminobutanoate/2-iminopropanoate deaminase
MGNSVNRNLIIGIVSSLLALQVSVVLASETADVEFFASTWNTSTEAPLSSAVRVGNLLYLSGALGLQGDKLAPGGITGETRAAMQNIERTLKKHGATLDDVVKCTVYLADMDEWAAMNAAYIPFFPNHKPARSAFGGNELGFDGRVEIECIAVLRD